MKRLFFMAALAVGFIAQAGNLKYVNASEFPMIGKGIAEDASASRYQRIPDSIQNDLPRPYLWVLGRCTSGMAIRFASDSPYINAKWTNTDKLVMNHFTATGIRGLDLYTLQPDGTWRYVKSAAPNSDDISTETTIISNMTPGVMRDYMLYLPLYDGVKDLEIGYDDAYTLAQPVNPALPEAGNPIVVYGTSITQGGCASRPGMSWVNMMVRRLNTEFVNLGFSGNGQLDLVMAPVVAGVENPKLFIMDFCANVEKNIIEERMLDFIKIIRDKHPDTPILFIENPIFPYQEYDTVIAEKVRLRNEAFREKYHFLEAQGDKNLFYLPSENFIGKDGEATVDGLHYTDLGFYRFAEVLEPAIHAILDSYEH